MWRLLTAILLMCRNTWDRKATSRESMVPYGKRQDYSSRIEAGTRYRENNDTMISKISTALSKLNFALVRVFFPLHAWKHFVYLFCSHWPWTTCRDALVARSSGLPLNLKRSGLTVSILLLWLSCSNQHSQRHEDLDFCGESPAVINRPLTLPYMSANITTADQSASAISSKSILSAFPVSFA